MWVRLSIAAAAVAITLAASVTAWVAFPTEADSELPAPLVAWTADGSQPVTGPYSKDLAPLVSGFRSQVYRSFCGPASVATVLRAYGAENVDQRDVFPSLGFKLDAFFSGVSLAQLATLARNVGLRNEIVYADTLSLDEFRERLKSNLSREGDFVLVNYDRRVLKQSGAGHISAVGAYDESTDAFLVADQAAYRYPFTWIPAELLYEAVHTRSGERFRGVLFIHGYDSPPD